MRQRLIEREFIRLQLMFGMFLGLLLMFLCISLVFARYNVKLTATYTQLQGEWYWKNFSGDEHLAEDITERGIAVGESVRLPAESMGRIELIPESHAYAYVMGGTEWRLVKASRHGTTWQHLKREEITYELIVEQLSGVVVYDLSQANPTLAELNLKIRLPNGEFEPTSDCFQATVPPADSGLTASVVEIPCSSAEQLPLTPAELPSLP